MVDRYAHILKAVEERPWALKPEVLRYMVDLAHFRAAGGTLAFEEIQQRLAAAAAENGPRFGGDRIGPVAIIPMYGLISQRMSLMSEMSGGTSVDSMRNDLRHAMADDTVRSIVFDIDSPGGSVDGITEFAAELRASREQKPIIAQVNTLAASAAYWLAASMSEIVVTASGEVGSIGVYATHQDISGSEANEGVKTTLVSAGPYKVEGNPYEPLTDEARGSIQGQVDQFYAMFLKDVADGRKTSVDQVAQGYGEGRTRLAKEALTAGMVDGIATLDATLSRLQPRAAARRAAEVVPFPIAASAAAGTPDRAWNARVATLTRSRKP